MQQSNVYVIGYVIALTVICGSLLALASEGLRPFKDANVALDTKKKVLSTAISIEGMESEAVEKVFQERVKSYVVNSKGNKIEGSTVDNIDISEEYSKAPEDRKLPVYEVYSEDKSKVEVYVFPLYGFGLWDNISGYVGLKSDLNTINGIVFSHKGETPGLGARIADKEIQERFYREDGSYKPRQIFENDELVAVTMMKGEGNDYSAEPHKVDGMSGATITAQGVNDMLKEYLQLYQPFIKVQKKGNVSLK